MDDHQQAFRRLPAVPAPRRMPVALAAVASAGVLATSLRDLPPAVLGLLAAAWFTALAVGALAPRTIVLTALAALVKPATAAMVIWVFASPHSLIGPRTALDWVPLGLLNMGTGLWLHAVIRRRAR